MPQGVYVTGPDKKTYLFPEGTTKDSATQYFRSKGIGVAPGTTATTGTSVQDPNRGAIPALKRLGIGAYEFGKDVLNPGEPLIEDVGGKESLYHKYLRDPVYEQSRQAQEAKAQGHRAEQLAHDVAAMIPLIGPIAAEAGREIGDKDYSGGAVTAVAALLGAKGLAGKRGTVISRVREGVENFKEAAKEAPKAPVRAQGALQAAPEAPKVAEAPRGAAPPEEPPTALARRGEPPSVIPPPEVPSSPQTPEPPMPSENVDWEQFTKGVLLQRTAQAERGIAMAAHAFKTAHDFVSKLSKEQQLELAYGMDEGIFQTGGWMRRVQEELRNALGSLKKEMQKLDPNLLNNYYENYWPREWEMPGLARSLIDRLRGVKTFGGTGIKGRASFMKPRTLLNKQGEPVTMREAVEQHGLKPVSYNLIDIFLLKTGEMQRFIAGQRILDDLNKEGLKRFFPSPRKVPEGWAKYDARWAGSDQYGPEDAVRTMNRFMSPGLFNAADPALRGGLSLVRKFNALHNQALVSLSAFHAGLVTTSAIVGDFGNAIRAASRGDFEGATRSLSTDSFIANIPRLNKLLNAYLKPGSLGTDMEQLIQNALKGGLKPQLADIYRTDALMGFRKALADRSPWGLAKNSIPAFLQWTSGPIMRGLVPRVKLFSTLMSVKRDMELLGPDATDAQMREAFARSVQTAEDWFGQMDPDNLVISHRYWGRAMAESLSVAFKFVEFSFGTLRGMYGAMGDMGKLSKGQMTPRLARAIAFPFVMYAMGMTAQKIMTGRAPWEADPKTGKHSDTPILDGFEPRTNRLNPDGTPERINLPTYWRTAVQWSRPTRDLLRGDLEEANTDLGKATRGRLSGGVDTLIMWYTNKDFYDREIRHSHIEDPAYLRPIKKLGDFVTGVIKDMNPISIRYAEEAARKGEGPATVISRMAGFQPVSATESRTLAQNKISEFISTGMGERPMTPSEYGARQARSDLRSKARSGDYSGVGPAMAKGEISAKQGARFVEDARKSLYDRSISLTPDEFLQVWDIATPKEKHLMRQPLLRERMKVLTGPVDERARLLPSYNKAWLEVRQ